MAAVGAASKPTREQAIAMLEDIYAQMPALTCKGLCHDTCTVADASELERQRIAERGHTIGPPLSHRRLLALIADDRTPRCPALSPLNTCSVYDVRPLICRLFGVAEGLTCEYGCLPEALIPLSEALRVLAEVEHLSEIVTGIAHRRPL